MERRGTSESARKGWPAAAMAMAGAMALALMVTDAAWAQQAGSGWQTGIEQHPGEAKAPATGAAKEDAGGQAAAPAATAAAEAPVAVRLEALLTADGQRIDEGLVWRVYREKGGSDGKLLLLTTRREAAAQVKLTPGEYLINVSFGRANLTRKVTVKPGAVASEQFVINAGGLRLTAHVGSQEAPAKSVSYQILSDERDQFGNRRKIMTGARPGLIIRLNAGIYQIVSKYGDANAEVKADVTVEAGKLTEATVTHAAARVTLKLVNRTGGEAIADTQWSLLTAQGVLIKESVGALPTHTLAPGSYIAVAKSGGNSYRREFAVQNGDTTQVEVLVR